MGSFSVLLLFAGLGCVATYVASLTLLLGRCQRTNAGFVLGCTAFPWWLSPTLYFASERVFGPPSEGLLEIPALYFLLCGFFLIIINLASIFMFSRGSELREEPDETSAICTETVSDDEVFNQESVSALRSGEFWMLTIAFALGNGVQTTIVQYVGFSMASLDKQSLRISMLWAGPMTGALARVSFYDSVYGQEKKHLNSCSTVCMILWLNLQSYKTSYRQIS